MKLHLRDQSLRHAEPHAVEADGAVGLLAAVMDYVTSPAGAGVLSLCIDARDGGGDFRVAGIVDVGETDRRVSDEEVGRAWRQAQRIEQD